MSEAREILLGELKQLFGELAGQDLSGAPGDANFFDLGFDSLFLTQASQALRKRFGVKITFRQMLEDLTTLDAMAAHLAEKAPAAAAPKAAPCATGRTFTRHPGQSDLRAAGLHVEPSASGGNHPRPAAHSRTAISALARRTSRAGSTTGSRRPSASGNAHITPGRPQAGGEAIRPVSPDRQHRERRVHRTPAAAPR